MEELIDQEDRKFHDLLEKLRRAEYALCAQWMPIEQKVGRLASANITLQEVVNRLRSK